MRTPRSFEKSSKTREKSDDFPIPVIGATMAPQERKTPAKGKGKKGGAAAEAAGAKVSARRRKKTTASEPPPSSPPSPSSRLAAVTLVRES